MPKPKSIDPGVQKNVAIPQSVLTQVDVFLYSSHEGRVPHGAYSRLITLLLRDWLAKLPNLTEPAPAPAPATAETLLAQLGDGHG